MLDMLIKLLPFRSLRRTAHGRRGSVWIWYEKKTKNVSACKHLGDGRGQAGKEKEMSGPIHRGLVSALIPEERSNSRVNERQKTKGLVLLALLRRSRS
jgi:hypothetical protein